MPEPLKMIILPNWRYTVVRGMVSTTLMNLITAGFLVVPCALAAEAYDIVPWLIILGAILGISALFALNQYLLETYWPNADGTKTIVLHDRGLSRNPGRFYTFAALQHIIVQIDPHGDYADDHATTSLFHVTIVPTRRDPFEVWLSGADVVQLQAWAVQYHVTFDDQRDARSPSPHG